MLLLGLCQFVEYNLLLTEEDEKTIKDLLKIIPRECFVQTAGSMPKLRIANLYYSIPPKELSK